MKIIKYLNVNKAHGHDDISVRMIKLCYQSIVNPLSVIFKNCIHNRIVFILLIVLIFVWKKSNNIPVPKKAASKSLILLDQLLFYQLTLTLLLNSILKFLDDDNDLLSSNQFIQNSDH